MATNHTEGVFQGRGPDWVGRIQSALRQGRLVFEAQPIVALATGEVARRELLVRIDEGGKLIGPGRFLAAAESFNLVQEIDLRALDEAIEWAREGSAVAANLSALSLNDPRYLARLERALEDGLNPSFLSFEMTETAAVSRIADAFHFARRIDDLGCSLALDDFGTGFCSFAHLKHIPARFLKIDMEFTRELPRSETDQRLVGTIARLAGHLGLQSVAEGVEDAETLDVVRGLGVDYAQGYFLGRPEPRPALASMGGLALPPYAEVAGKGLPAL